MTDEELCAEVARLWVRAGGDVESLSWCWQKIVAAVRGEIARQATYALPRHPDAAAPRTTSPEGTYTEPQWQPTRPGAMDAYRLPSRGLST